MSESTVVCISQKVQGTGKIFQPHLLSQRVKQLASDNAGAMLCKSRIKRRVGGDLRFTIRWIFAFITVKTKQGNEQTFRTERGWRPCNLFSSRIVINAGSSEKRKGHYHKNEK